MVKYNFSLDNVVQNSSVYDGYLQIGINGSLVLVTKKPSEIQEYVEEGENASLQEDLEDHATQPNSQKNGSRKDGVVN